MKTPQIKALPGFAPLGVPETFLYRAWISGQMQETAETVNAPSSFAARKYIAHKYRLDITDACARRCDWRTAEGRKRILAQDRADDAKED